MKLHRLATTAVKRFYLNTQARPKSHVILACMPKSASSFLSQTISGLPSFHKVSLHSEGQQTEQIINKNRLIRHNSKNYVAQLHVCYGDGTAKKMDQFNLVPIVMTRDLFDCVASFRDHIRNESHMLPMAWLEKDHAQLADAELENMIADLVMPWYVKFYTSWRNCPEATWIKYEDVRADPENVVAQICSVANINANEDDIFAAVEAAKKAPKRFNRGVNGRGNDISSYAKDRIRKLLTHYPSHSFDVVVNPNS